MKKLILLLLLFLLPFISNAQTKLEYKAANFQMIFDNNIEHKIVIDSLVSYSGYFILDKGYTITSQYDNFTKTTSSFEVIDKEISEDYNETTYTYLIRPSYTTINVIYSIQYPNSLWVAYDVSENVSHIIEYKISNILQIKKPRIP